MYTYSIVVLCILGIIILITNKCVVEGLDESVDESREVLMSTSSPLAISLSAASTNLSFYTANSINYDFVDTRIQYLEKQYMNLKSICDNLTFVIGEVNTTGSCNDKPSARIGGNYPSNIVLNFDLPPPRPGDAGNKGIKGKKGSIGMKGVQGVKGVIGGNKICK